MQQGFFGGNLGIVERHGAASRQLIRIDLLQCVARDTPGAAALAPQATFPQAVDPR